MAIDYMIETLLFMGFMLSVLVVCKWAEDFKQALKTAKSTKRSVWAVLRADECEELIDQTTVEAPVVYLKVSNPQLPVKTSVRAQAQALAMKKAANSE